MLCWILTAVVALGGFSLAQSSEKSNSGSAQQKLIGAWHVVSLEDVGSDGKATRVTAIKGMLIYTRDGHMSVQLMLPDSESDVSNDYVKNGYEASFGSFDVDEKAHTVTHHVQGSVTRGLIGKDLPRAFRFDNSHLIITSTRPDEHWSVTWEHY